jgi:hypothetical protein
MSVIIRFHLPPHNSWRELDRTMGLLKLRLEFCLDKPTNEPCCGKESQIEHNIEIVTKYDENDVMTELHLVVPVD